MRSVLVQDWLTIRGVANGVIIQTEGDWFDAAPYSDVILWIEVAEVTHGGSGVTLDFETAPLAQDNLFTAIDSVTFTGPTTSPTVRKIFMSGATNVVGPTLARWLRWKANGSSAAVWDITFRVWAQFSEGIRDAFSPLNLPGLLLWLRADLGVVTSGAFVTDWKDQSGNGNHVAQATGANQPRLTGTIGGRLAIDFATSKFLENTTNNLVSPAGSAYSVFIVAKNGSGTILSLRRSITYSGTMFFGTTSYVWSDGSPTGANTTVLNTTSITQSSTTAFKSCHRYKGTGQRPDVFLNENQLAITGGAGGGNQSTEGGTTGFQVGTNAQLTPEFWNGLIAEIIVTSGAVTDEDRRRVEGYQRVYYGV